MITPFIKGLGTYVPEKLVSNDDLSKFVDTSDEWIYSHTGIKTRYFAAENEKTSDLAIAAAEKALLDSGVKAEEIDQIILATGSPDYIGFPSTACIVQDKIKAVNASAYDVFAACSGFVYSIDIAKNFIKAGGAKNILVIGSEVFSRVLNWEDRGTCVLFGDGAGAAVVSGHSNGDKNSSAILNSYMRAIGSGESYLKRPAGGIAEPFIQGETDPNGTCITMNGRRVYNFAVNAVSETVEKLLKDANLTIDDIKYIVPHQANTRIIEAVSKRTSIPYEKFYMNIDKYANTSAASIPLAFTEAVKNNSIKKGDYIIFVGFGGGLTYGGNIIRW